MHDRAAGASDDNGTGVRNTVANVDELNVERADLHSLPVLHQMPIGVLPETVFMKFGPDESQRKPRRPDGHREFTEDVRQRADVILVSMGHDDAEDLLSSLQEEGD